MADYCDTPATLTLSLPNGPTVDLMSDQQGFRISEVDLGYPEVRGDADDAADRHGQLDFTRLFGARAVTISGFVVPSPAGSRSRALQALAPFLDPAARPVLTYQIDGDAVTKTLTLRPSEFSSPFNSRTVSDWQAGWKCPDPLAYDARVQTATAGVYTGGAGRAYNLTFNRIYPPASGGLSAQVHNVGSFTVWPLLRIYGPASGGANPNYPGLGTTVVWAAFDANLAQVTPPFTSFAFVAGFAINAGDYVEVDCRRRTALVNGNPAQSVYGSVAFWNPSLSMLWPFCPPGGFTNLQLSYATGTTNTTQLQVQWQDAYLL